MSEDRLLRLRRGADALEGYVHSMTAHVKAASSPLSGRAFTVGDQVVELFKLNVHFAGTLTRAMRDIADILEGKA